jgi:Flp pilus assembly protein TadG
VTATATTATATTTRLRRPVGPAPPRDGERGAVAIVVAALWMTLFGLAALAVDAGYLYQSSRGLQAAADAAVMAGLPAMQTSSSTAIANATSMATASGYTTGVTVSATSTQLTVAIQVTQPRFFGAILGFPVKTLRATAVGQTNPPVPAVFASGAVCPSSSATPGVQFNGDGFTIKGNVQSNASVNYFTGGTANTTTGAVTYNPACSYSSGGNPPPTGGASPTGGSMPYPYSYTISSFPACTFGTLGGPVTNLNLGTPGAFWATGGPSGGTLVSGVYCANGNISLGANSVTGTVTFVATGTITIGSNTGTLTGYYNNMLAFTTSAQNCTGSPGPAMSVGNASIVLNGSFDAPNGCINVSGSAITVNGSLVGADVTIGAGSASVIDSTAGAGPGGYLYQ